MDSIKLLKKFSEVNGVPGNEKLVRLLMKEELIKIVGEENIEYDGLGSIVGKLNKKENGPKIAVVGHMDEIGMIITKITDEGFLRFQTVGGWWSQVMLAQQMTITTREGKTYRGVIGSKPPHILSPEELKNPASIDNMYIDLGVANKKEVEDLGIKIGDMITPAIDFQVLANPKYLLGKAWDNRAGCCIALEVLDKLKDEDLPNTVIAVGTVQEEVGLRGAKTVANLIKPDIVFALDVGIAQDTPGTDMSIKIGEGPGIFLYDGSMVGHVGLREAVLKVADELKIPYQLDYLKRGGTDAGAMHLSNNGVPSMAICIPTRYIHSHTSIMHEDDYQNAIKIISEVIKRLDWEQVNKITYE